MSNWIPKYVFHSISFLVLSLNAVSQANDSSVSSKWVNYDRSEERPFYQEDRTWDKLFVTGKKDTLQRRFRYSHFRDTGPILYENSIVNGKRNGLSVGYHPNGQVYSISYYLDNLLWETISLADSTGKLYHPGNLINGTGIVPFLSNDGQSLGFQTYKSGHLTGPYLHKDVYGSTAIQGEVRYKPECVNFQSAWRVTYIDNGDTLHSIFEANFFELVSEAFQSSKTRIIGRMPDSLKEPAQIYEGINEHFGETEIVPIGKWRYFDYVTNVTLIEYEYDDCGNEIKRTYYNDAGQVRDIYRWPPDKKRKKRGKR